MSEVVIDPVEVATGRTELVLHQNIDNPIRIGPDGPDWGEAAIQAYMSEQRVGEVPVDYRIPNRQVRIPLLLGASGAAGFAAARTQLQQKVGLLWSEGGWLARDTLYADVVNASLVLPDVLGLYSVEADVILTLECLPDFYGVEVEIAHGS